MKTVKLILTYPHQIIAVDEVGRGPLGGPVVIGAVRVLIQDEESYRKLIKFLKLRKVTDSKKISADLRAKILDKLGIQLAPYRQMNSINLSKVTVDYITWEMDHEVIDRENILGASLRGMKEAAIALSKSKKWPTTVLIDGNQKFRWGNEKSLFTEIPIVKGDSKSVLIGLASIIAKEKRDLFMMEMHELYPQYGFDQNAGYPTASHREAIRIHGPSPIHRKTFKGVKEFWTQG